MKKKTGWKTLAGLVLAASAWRKLSEDLPIDGVIIPPPTEVCAYPNLTLNEINMRLLNLEMDYSEGRVTRAYYDAEYAKLRICRTGRLYG